MEYSDNAGLPKERPNWITTICILAIVFGAVGILSGSFVVLSQIFASSIQSMVAKIQQGSNLPGMEIQGDLLARMTAITTKYNFALIPLGIAKLGVEAVLLVGGILSLKLKARGRSLIVGALFGALIVESILVVPRIMMQREIQATMAEVMPTIMAAAPNSEQLPPGFNAGMSSMFAGVGAITAYSAVAWVLIKVVIYLIGINYLRKPQTVALFENT